ncbi:MCE family protein [Qaidamihabitans albus]|uniref:MCE family protein n=1 Tax=Qaidamihabitans albus TaxID=2795733 RepID=UPI0018F2670D|nr:MCE family protein [Qaidamihabitans albus]
MIRLLTRRATLVVLVVLALTAGAFAVTQRQPRELTLTAEFRNTTSLYQGADVKILGVSVGKITKIEVRGTSVHVEMTYDAEHPLPANVHAAVIPPSIVGDRFVQLAPAYTGGPQLPDNASLGLDRTEVPIELDEVYRNLSKLAEALGPEGANSDGALSRLITAVARNMEGNGGAMNATIRNLADAVGTLSDSRQDISATVSNLSDFTTMLAGNDEEVRALVSNLAKVSTQLGTQRDDIATATRDLSEALQLVSGFVARNRELVKDNVNGLTEVTGTLSRRSDDLAELIDIAPLGLTNMMNIYVPENWDLSDPGAVPPQNRAGSLALRAPLFNDLTVQLGHTMTAICGSLPHEAQKQVAALCSSLQRAGGDLAAVLTRLIDPALGGGLTPSQPARTLPELLTGGR